MKKIFYFLWILFHPNFWIMNYPYSEAWDKHLNDLLNNYNFTMKGRYTAFLGDTEIWIENYPYACFLRFPCVVDSLTFRPSRKTIHRARKKLIKDLKI